MASEIHKYRPSSYRPAPPENRAEKVTDSIMEKLGNFEQKLLESQAKFEKETRQELDEIKKLRKG